MREIPLRTSAGVTRIVIGRGLLERIADIVPAAAPPMRGALIVDGALRKSAGALVKRFADTGRLMVPFVVAGGERSKSLATLERLLRGFARERLERQSTVAAFGGGVVGDLGGFAAAVWQRGVALLQIPTTLLAQVDASIGGKTAVNLPEGKNLVGAFHQAQAVLIDPELLRSLPAREFVGGLGEIVKYGMIADEPLLGLLERRAEDVLRRDGELLEELIHRCVTIKVDVVQKDEREGGPRAILNYGHTVGHGLEAALGYGRIHHGEAVALGMEAAAFMAHKLGLASVETLARQNGLLARLGLPTRLPGAPRRDVLRLMQSDKKVRGGRLRFVLPERPGKARHGVDVPPDLVEAALKAVLGR